MSDIPRLCGTHPGLTMAFHVEDEGWNDLGLSDPGEAALTAMRIAARHAGLPADLVTEVGVTLSDDAHIRALNAEWRGKDKPTNILSFPIVQLSPGERPGPMLGDLVLARETLLREAAGEDKAVCDHYLHLIVHGFLHLIGYDHMEDHEAEAMERLEIGILSDLSVADPYAAADTKSREGGASVIVSR